MTAAILGVGTASPLSRLRQKELADAAVACCCSDRRQERVLRELYRRSGVSTRGCAILDATADTPPRGIGDCFPAAADPHDRGPTTARRMAWYTPSAHGLAERAAQAALVRAEIEPEDIAHLVTVSCTGFAAPGVDRWLIDRLVMRTDVQRTHVGFMGCHGALNGLRVAAAHTVQRQEPALLVCVEVCTAHFQYGWRPERVVSNALFADGSAAAVLVPAEPGATACGFGRVASSLSVVLDDTRDAMTWAVGDHGFEMTLSPSVPALIEQHLAGRLLPWLDRAGVAVHDVGGWAVHPGGPRVLRSAMRALELPASAGEASRAVLRDHGNMSSPTVLFIAEALRERGVPKPWVLLAFGPGLAIEALLLTD